MPESSQCRQCGAPLPAGWPKGLCSRCALQGALELSSGPSEALPPEGAEASSSSGQPPAAGSLGTLKDFGDYELLEEIARGGMGIVYRARQKSLDRIVAVKLLLLGQHASKESIHRFRIEASAAASLQHPNIVAIHEVGVHQGQHYFAMDFVDGPDLAQLVRDQPLSPKRAAGYVKTIAEAIHFAHTRHILHRDLKPSNVLIDASDQPRVTDFGLAKRLGASELRTQNPEVTQSGQVLGSPSFLPPEQALGERGKMGPASDVYSLGAILYHALTGRPPFVAETLPQTLRMVAENEAVSPRLLNASVPRDLETICLKCLEKDPKRRYATAQELADELDRFLRDEPIQARPANQVEKVWRWCRRHPAVALLGVAVLALLLTVAVGSVLYARSLAAANQRATEKLREAYIGQARASRWSGQAGRRFNGLELLNEAARIRPSSEIRNEAIACLALEDIRVVREIELPTSGGLNFDPTFESYVMADAEGNILIRSCADDHELLHLPGTGRGHYGFCFTPDGQYLCAFFDARPRHQISVYDLKSQQPLFSVTNRWGARLSDAAPDGKRLIVALNNTPCPVMAYALSSGHATELATLPAMPVSLRVSPEGDRVALASRSPNMVEVRAMEGWQLLTRRSLPGTVRGLDWHPDGRLLAAACGDRKIHLWDTTTGQQSRAITGHDRDVTGVHFTHGGNLLASVSWDNTFRLWNVWDGAQILRRDCFGESTRFSVDDHRIGLATSHSFELGEMAGGREWRGLHPEEDPSEGWQCAWSSDGRMLVSGHKDCLRLWNVASGREFNLRLRDVGECWGVAFDPAGAHLIAGTSTGLRRWATTWEQAQTEQRLTLGEEEKFGPGCSTGSLFLNEAGSFLATACGGVVRIFEWPAGREIQTLKLGSGVFGCALSPSGRLCLGWPYAGNLPRRVWDVTTGAVLTNLPAAGIYGAAFTPDDRFLITGSSDDYVAWDTQSWKPAWKLPRPSSGSVQARVAVTRDGAVGALTVAAQVIRLFDPATGRELASLEAPEAQTIDWVAFSPEGSQLAATTQAGTVHVWNLGLIRQELGLMKLDWAAPSLPPATPFPARPIIISASGPTNAALLPNP